MSDPGAAADRARSLAVADARARAEALASDAELTLGRILTIGAPMDGGGYGGFGGAYPEATPAAMPIEGGVSQVTTQVQVTFEVR